MSALDAASARIMNHESDLLLVGRDASGMVEMMRFVAGAEGVVSGLRYMGRDVIATARRARDAAVRSRLENLGVELLAFAAEASS